MKNEVKRRELDINQFELRFRRRYILKKSLNMLGNAFIAFCGISSILYSVFVYGSSFFDRLRYMTFDGTIFTILVSLVFVVVAVYEAVYETELTYRNVYFLRLSSATTEFVIFAVVMIGLLPIVPDNPDITSYTGFMMHIVIPIVAIANFIFNDAPLGKMKIFEPFNGTMFVTVYAMIMTTLFGLGILPPEKAPYSFLNFRDHSLLFSIGCLIVIYIIGYSISFLMIILNKHLSWIWFADLHHLRKRKKRSSGNG